MDTNTNSGKNLQDELMESAHRIWLAGLGALAAAEEEGTKVFSKLVERGKDVEAKGKEQATGAREQVKSTVENVKNQAADAWSGISDKLDERLTTALHRLGVPTREEIRSLAQKVEELTAKVDQLKPRVTPASGAPPTIVTPTGEPVSEA